MELEFRHLRMIRAIGDAGSVTKAADRLGLAQSALSTQLKRIENALGGRRFERSRAGVRPTPLGVLVPERSRVLLPAMRQLQEDAVRSANAARENSGLRLGGRHLRRLRQLHLRGHHLLPAHQPDPPDLRPDLATG